jgi:hypothetical protein
MLIFLSNANPNDPNPVVQAMAKYWQAMKQELPEVVAIETARSSVGLLLAVMLIVAGIGLLNLKSWGRTLSLVYAVLMILFQLAGLLWTLLFFNPVNTKLQGQIAGVGGNQTASDVGAVVGSIIGMAYAVVLLIMLMTSGVAGAFRPGQAGLVDTGFADEADAPDAPPRDPYRPDPYRTDDDRFRS